jgi:uncharacterized membrane protein YkoI
MSVMSPRLRVVPLLAAVCFTSSVGVSRAVAQETAASGDTLARQVRSAPISLARGLSAARARGTPISAKYELEEGKPQLSVYTAKDNRFWEVIVDHRTGRIAKAEEITQGDDLTAAKAQSDAMAKGKRSLSAAVTRALRENRGSHVVSVVPSVEAGHPVATVRLVKGRTFKTVSEPLN